MSAYIAPFNLDLLPFDSEDLEQRARLGGIQRQEAIAEIRRRLVNRELARKPRNYSLEGAYLRATGERWQTHRSANVVPLIR